MNEYVVGRMDFDSMPTWTDSLVQYLKQDPSYVATRVPTMLPDVPTKLSADVYNDNADKTPIAATATEDAPAAPHFASPLLVHICVCK